MSFTSDIAMQQGISSTAKAFEFAVKADNTGVSVSAGRTENDNNVFLFGLILVVILWIK
jgi:hypothetical protein